MPEKKMSYGFTGKGRKRPAPVKSSDEKPEKGSYFRSKSVKKGGHGPRKESIKYSIFKRKDKDKKKLKKQKKRERKLAKKAAKKRKMGA